MNIVHPSAIIGKNVTLGDNNTIGAYAIIEGNTFIGNNNQIGPHTAIGVEPTDTKHVNFEFGTPQLIIGNNNVIREFCVIEQPCYEAESRICNDVFLMQGVHLSHDNILYDHVVITNQCVIGGIAKILEGADLGMGCTINQYTIVGQYCIVATGAACMKNVKPFSRYIPGKPISVNNYAIKKYGYTEFSDEIAAYVLDDVIPTSNRIKQIVDEFDHWVQKYGHETYK